MDTNVLLQLFGASTPLAPLRRALLAGRLELALSTEILLEYQEVVTRLSGAARWHEVAAFIDVLGRLHGTIIRVEPAFRFSVITAAADFVVTADQHFAALVDAGYRPQPIAPDAFVNRLPGQAGA